MQILHVLNQPDAEIKLTEDHVQEIKEYLKALDLIESCPVRYQSDVTGKEENRSNLRSNLPCNVFPPGS